MSQEYPNILERKRLHKRFSLLCLRPQFLAKRLDCYIRMAPHMRYFMSSQSSSATHLTTGTMNYASTLLWVAWLTSLLPNIRAIYSVPGLPPSAYHMDGDLLLGGIFRVHQYRYTCRTNVRP